MTTVYTKTGCVQCTATCRTLDKAGITYHLIHLDQDPDALAAVRALGHHQAPVVVTDTGEHWAGHRPDRCRGLVA